MININYQLYGSRGFQLRLRLYQSGETRFINVTRMLKGTIQRKHWNQKKQVLLPSCPFSEENNLFLVKLRQKYQEAAIDWFGSVEGLLEHVRLGMCSAEPDVTLAGYFQIVIAELKQRRHADGTVKGTYECYEKCDRRIAEYCKSRGVDYSRLPLKSLTPGFVNDLFVWVEKNNRGKSYVSKMLHAVIMRADREELLEADAFNRCNWWRKPLGSSQKFHTLTEEQCRRFAALTVDEMPPGRMSELYRDFCLFILYTGQSPCDAISLRYSDIEVINGVSHFVFRRRKISEKQAVPCAVPISADLQRIMDRWLKYTKDGYVLPIRSREKLRTNTVDNGDIKHFIGNINLWLKKVAKVLDCAFSLHCYTFRHTAITHYISKGVPVLYVANMMGTSVENCEKIYYNNQGDVASLNKVMNVMGF